MAPKRYWLEGKKCLPKNKGLGCPNVGFHSVPETFKFFLIIPLTDKVNILSVRLLFSKFEIHYCSIFPLRQKTYKIIIFRIYILQN